MQVRLFLLPNNWKEMSLNPAFERTSHSFAVAVLGASRLEGRSSRVLVAI
jgi:hypothetical protein